MIGGGAEEGTGLPARAARAGSRPVCVGAAVLLVLVASLAPAAGRSAVAPLACTSEGGEPVRVAAVTDDLGLRLADGRLILLAGIDPLRATAEHPDLASEARARLGGWLNGTEAVLHPLTPVPDRWGRIPALVFARPTSRDPADAAQDDGASLSVALAMVDAGLARARPNPALHACWPALAQAEAGARQAALGLWRDPYYSVRRATDMAGIASGMGSMAIVEGRVSRVGQGRTRVFIELGGPDGEVTLRLARRDSFILAELGLHEDRLVGLTLRARGFLDDRFGPSIDITTPDQVEVVDVGTARAGVDGMQN